MVDCFEKWNVKLYRADCIEIMKTYPDKYFELACVDPEYGLHDKILKGGRNGKVLFGAMYEKKQWDKERASKEYFDLLIQKSKNQIICGGNYFADLLPPSRGWVIWDKMGDKLTVVNDELLWTSFDYAIKKFKRCHSLDKGFMNKEGRNIHPTQKPIALYDWIYENYADKSFKIIDTHSGSFSSAISAYNFGCAEFVGCEIDCEYFENGVKRFDNMTNQTKIEF